MKPNLKGNYVDELETAKVMRNCHNFQIIL